MMSRIVRKKNIYRPRKCRKHKNVFDITCANCLQENLDHNEIVLRELYDDMRAFEKQRRFIEKMLEKTGKTWYDGLPGYFVTENEEENAEDDG